MLATYSSTASTIAHQKLFTAGGRTPRERLHRHWQYEEYILNEVIPLMNQKNPHDCIISHGCSFWGFSRSKYRFPSPIPFQKTSSILRPYDLTEGVENFGDLLDGHYDDSVYFNMPTHFLSNVNDEHTLQHLRNMDITFVIGREDPFIGNNEYMSQILNNKGISHDLHYWDTRAHIRILLEAYGSAIHLKNFSLGYTAHHNLECLQTQRYNLCHFHKMFVFSK